MSRKPIVDYWIQHYINKGLCSLCGNHGTIDTSHVMSPAGVKCGRINFCICPNGQELRKIENKRAKSAE